MSSMWGADLGRLETMERQMRAACERLGTTQVSLRAQVAATPWRGADGDRFRAAWDQDIRPALVSAVQQLAAAADTMQRNRLAQQQVSAAEAWTAGAQGSQPVYATAAPFSDAAALGASVRSVDGGAALYLGGATGALDLAGVPNLGPAGVTFSAFSAVANGAEIGEDLAGGRYVDAALHTGLAGGDIAADTLKAGRTPLSYAGGIAVQSWTEAGREAMNVDWSPEGMRLLREASLDDWTSAFSDAVRQMPGKLVKIFF